MLRKFLSIAILGLSLRSPRCMADGEGYPLSGDIKNQVDNLSSAFADRSALVDTSKQISVMGEIRLYSMPPPSLLPMTKNNAAPLHGMPALIYQVIESLDENNQWGIAVSGGYAAFRGLISSDFSYRQESFEANVLLGHRFERFALLAAGGYHYTRAQMAGNFVVDDAVSRIAFDSAVPLARLIARVNGELPLQCEWLLAAPQSNIRLRLGEGGSDFYSQDATPWGIGATQFSVLMPWTEGSVGMGYIHDARHGDFFRLAVTLALYQRGT